MVDFVTRAGKGSPLTYAELDGNFNAVKGILDALAALMPLSVTAKPAIVTDGTPQVGETLTGTSGIYPNGVVTKRAWLLNGSAISGANGANYIPQATGTLVYREYVAGPAGQIVVDSDPVTVAAATVPQLTLPGTLTFATTAAAGTLVTPIGNVPSGAAPTLTPNDGRLVVAGDATNGWKVVVGMTASSAGTIAITVAASGATGASANVTVTTPGAAVITSPAAVAQPGASQRFFRATADRGGTWSKGSDGNAADFTGPDASTGIFSVGASAIGDGSAQIVKTLPLVFTPADGSGAVTQSVTVSLATATAPSQLSPSFVTDLSGAAGKRLDQVEGWAASNGQPGNGIVLDGNGALVQGSAKNDAQEYLTQVPKLAGTIVTWPILVGDGMLGLVLASDGAGNKIEVLVQTQGAGGGAYIPGNQLFTTQGGTATQVGTANLYTAYNINNAAVEFQAVFAADGKSVTLGFVGGNATTTLDLTGLTLGKGFGFGFERYNGWPVYSSARVGPVRWVSAITGIRVTSLPQLSYTNQVNVSLAWDTTLAKPTGFQHSFDNISWFTGDSTINSDGTIAYAATAPSGSNAGTNMSFRPINDILVTAAAPNKIRFLAPPAKFGANIADTNGWANAASTQFQVFDNLFNQGYWQDPSNGYSYDVTGKVDADGMPLVSGLIRQIGHGPTSGEMLELTWTGCPGMTIALNNTEGNTVFSGLSQPAAQTFRWTDTYSYDGQTPTFGGVIFNNIDASNPPKNIQIRVVGQAAPQFPPFADAYVALEKLENGPDRLMDIFRVNNLNDGSATFAQHRKFIEWAITLSNATGRDPYFNIPIYSSDAYITAVVQAFDKGTGTSNGVALKAGLSLYVGWGNEVWNSAFAAYGILINKYVARTGEAQLPDNGGGVEQRYKEHAFQHNHAMSVVEAAVPTFASRVVRVLETQTGTYHYQVVKQAGGAHYDAHAQAPYFCVPTNPDKSMAALGVTWKQAGIARITSLNAAAQQTYADGARYICYEAGPDFLADPTGAHCDLSAADRLAFKRSPQFYEVMRSFFGAWADQYGDVMPVYTDLGLDLWGMMLSQGDPQAYGYAALIDAVAGGTAHRPSS